MTRLTAKRIHFVEDLALNRKSAPVVKWPSE